MQNYPHSMFQSKIKYIHPRLEKVLCWESNRVNRGVEACTNPLDHRAILKMI